MPGQGRLGDAANITNDAHGCPGCPHPGSGPAIQGSADVFVNGRPALRVDDVGIHAACCGTNMWQAQQGAPTVFINGKAAFRMNDPSKHCGGQGKLIEGSNDVIVGDAASGGGGGGGGGGSSSDSANNDSANNSANNDSTNNNSTNNESSKQSQSSDSPNDDSKKDPAKKDSTNDASPDQTEDEEPQAANDAWVGFELRDEDGGVLDGEPFALIASDRSVHSGALDDSGAARVEALPDGECRVRFENFDDDDILSELRLPTGEQHRLTARNPQVQFVLRDDDGEPHAKKRYELVVAGKTHQGTTDERGVVSARVSPRATDGELRVWLSDDDCRVYPLDLTPAGES